MGKFNAGKRIDQRKWNGASTRRKKQAGGAKGKGNFAFVPKAKPQKDDGLQKRIELVVENAMRREAEALAGGHDVIRHNRWSVYHHVRATKLG